MASKDDFRCPINEYDPEKNDYIIWRKEAQLWNTVTDLKHKKRGLALCSRLKGRAKGITDGMDNDILSANNGFEQIILKLDASFAPDAFEREFWPLHDLFTFKKTPEMEMENYLLDYNQKYQKFIQTSGHISDTVAAYKLLSGAGLTVSQIQSVKAALRNDITYENMKTWLKSLFVPKKCNLAGNGSEPSTSASDPEQATLYADRASEYNRNDEVFLAGRGRHRSYNSGFRGKSRGFSNFRNRGSSGSRPRGFSRRDGYRSPSIRQDDYKRTKQNQEEYRRSKQNPRDRNTGYAMACNFCGSTLHFMAKCPDYTKFLKESEGNSKAKEDVGYIWFMVNTVYMTDQPGTKMQGLVDECKGLCILDCGCPNTVCGEKWIEYYIQTLSTEDQEAIVFEDSKERFTFGDGDGFKSNRKMTIPIYATGKRGLLQTDVVSANIPLLLSVKVMENAGMVLDFARSEARMKGTTIKLKKTTSGHYAMPLSL